MAKYTVNIEYIDKYSYNKVKAGSVVELEDGRYNEIVSILGEEALKTFDEKETKEEAKTEKKEEVE
ncbi:hypothetical protein [Gemella sp. Musashino-2025]